MRFGSALVWVVVAVVLADGQPARACQPWCPGPWLGNATDGIPGNGGVVLRLDRDADPANVTLSVENSEGSEVPGSIELVPGNSPHVTLVIWRPNVPFDPNAEYSMNVAGGFGGFDGEATLHFTTVDPAGTISDPLAELEPEFDVAWAAHGEEYCCCAAVYTCTYGPTCLYDSYQTVATVGFAPIAGMDNPGSGCSR